MMRSSSRQHGVSWGEQRGVDTTLYWEPGAEEAEEPVLDLHQCGALISTFLSIYSIKYSLVQLTPPLFFSV